MTKLKEGHLVLYSVMKDQHEKKLAFTKEMMLDIYKTHVMFSQGKHSYAKKKLPTEEQIYNNASAWMNKAIIMLVRRGYLGLMFNKDAEAIPCQT